MQASLIANCVFNAFLPFTAITLNMVTIHALRKPLTIPGALKVLLLSLAVSDLGVGLLVQPLYITSLVMLIKENTQTRTFEITFNFFHATGNFLACASFFGVVALSGDRFLALHLHLRYQELLTHKRVITVVISIWIIRAILMLLSIWIPNAVRIILLYITNAERERKAAVGTFYVYLVFLICYLPFTCVWIILRSAGPSTMLLQFGLYANTLVFLNSSLNSLIYSWKMRHVRHAIMEILRNILPHPHQ